MLLTLYFADYSDGLVVRQAADRQQLGVPSETVSGRATTPMTRGTDRGLDHAARHLCGALMMIAPGLHFRSFAALLPASGTQAAPASPPHWPTG